MRRCFFSSIGRCNHGEINDIAVATTNFPTDGAILQLYCREHGMMPISYTICGVELAKMWVGKIVI